MRKRNARASGRIIAGNYLLFVLSPIAIENGYTSWVFPTAFVHETNLLQTKPIGSHYNWSSGAFWRWGNDSLALNSSGYFSVCKPFLTFIIITMKTYLPIRSGLYSCISLCIIRILVNQLMAYHIVHPLVRLFLYSFVSFRGWYRHCLQIFSSWVQIPPKYESYFTSPFTRSYLSHSNNPPCTRSLSKSLKSSPPARV